MPFLPAIRPIELNRPQAAMALAVMETALKSDDMRAKFGTFGMSQIEQIANKLCEIWGWERYDSAD